MKSYFPEKKSIIILDIIVVFMALALIAAAFFVVKIKMLTIILSIVLAAVVFVIIFIYLPLYFSRLSYTATDTEISKTSGVFFKTNQSIKYSSIQYSTVVFTPFSGYTGINFIIFYVYGGRLLLLFLKKKDLQEIINKSRINCC